MGVDRDEDTVLNAIDNCPATSNFFQVDSDGDGLGDACDDDPGSTTTTVSTTTTSVTFTTTSTTTSTTTTVPPTIRPFITRSLKIGRLRKPAGEQKLSLKSDDLDGFAPVFNPITEDWTLIFQVGGDVVGQATIPAGDPDWKLRGSKFKWRAKSAPHPAGLKTVQVGVYGGPFKVKVNAKNIDGSDAAGVSSFVVTMIIGDDVWSGPTPPCRTNGSGNTLKCR
jgi:hypothetical protein